MTDLERKGNMAIIGGSGVYDSPLFERLEWKLFDTGLRTEWGDGRVYYQDNGDGIIFIPRHGLNNFRLGPCRTQYAANLIAARELGAKVVVATSAVGSLRVEEGFKVGSLVIPEDYIDETNRDDNLFGRGIVVHASLRPPFSSGLREILASETAGEIERSPTNGTYVVIPGDRFGTAAEGKKRSQYAHIVGMTICPEASLAMQLGMHYAAAAFIVDNDIGANHEHGTLAIMRKLSEPDKVPAYIAAVAEKAKAFARQAEPLLQLKGNIIPDDLNRIENLYLKKIAEELVQTYCR